MIVPTYGSVIRGDVNKERVPLVLSSGTDIKIRIDESLALGNMKCFYIIFNNSDRALL